MKRGIYGRLFGGSFVVLVGNVLGMGIAFLTRVVLARLLGVDGYGVLAFCVSLLELLTLVTSLGMEEGVARNIPRHEDPGGIFLTAIQVAFGTALIAAGILALFSTTVSKLFLVPTAVPVVTLFAVALPFQSVVWLSLGGFRGIGDATRIAVVQNVLLRGAIVLFAVVGIYLGYGIVGAAAGWVVGTAVTAGLAVLILAQETSLLSSAQRTYSRLSNHTVPLLRFSVPLVIATAAWQLIQATDDMVIGYFLPPAEIGVFDAAFTTGRIMLLFVWSFSALFLPMFSELDDDETTHEEMTRLYSLVTKWVVVFTLPVFLFVVGFPGTIMTALFGEAYTSGGLVLAIVVAGFFVEVTTGMTRAALTAIGDTTFIFWTTTATIIANVGLGILLVPSFGIVGVAAATAVTYAALNVGSAIRLYVERGFHALSDALARITGSSVALFGLLYVLFGSSIRSSLPLVLLSGMVFYVVHMGLFFAVGGLEAEDFELLKGYADVLPIDINSLRDLLNRR
ncbi:oligosaccharide flippase family protein [Haladaptatus caseinilyticus]|uniref:oligosaccharide flippase family protein n=1 Tax=Haladaptatus caseinilyticus TaxID=2993314 RepID=UPI00224B7D22|nr:oligosaccharide flippase family protein [Haladaptatus caseinilyticus]